MEYPGEDIGQGLGRSWSGSSIFHQCISGGLVMTSNGKRGTGQVLVVSTNVFLGAGHDQQWKKIDWSGSRILHQGYKRPCKFQFHNLKSSGQSRRRKQKPKKR